MGLPFAYSSFVTRFAGAARFLCLLLCLVIAVWKPSASSLANSHPRNILVLLAGQPELPASQSIVKGLESALKEDPNIQIYYEFLDAMRFPDPTHLEQSRYYLQTKYRTLRFDLAIAIGPEALSFLLERGKELIAPGDIVFGGISEHRIQSLDPNVAGVASRFDIDKTLELARLLQPELKHIAVVSGATPFDKSWEAAAREKLGRFATDYEVSYLAGLTIDDLLRRVSQLPQNSAVLYLSVFRDGSGTPFISRDVVEKVARASAVPVYGVYDTYIGQGIVGGFMDTFEGIGRQVGRLALRRSSGQGVQKPAVEMSQGHNFIVDSRALARFGYPESALPANTEIRFKSVSPWRVYKDFVLLTLAVMIGLSLLVLKFHREVISRRRAEQAATDSRDQIELSVSAANLGLWEWNPVTDKVWTSDHCRKLLGLDAGALVGREDFLNCLQGEDRALAVARMTKAMMTGNQCEAEYSLVQPDGSVRWVSSRASPKSRRGGKPDHLLGVLVDVTERKHAEREASEQRKQLTHLTRVSVLGALSGALAHELNQPLTAILSNAQAARRLLGRKPYDMDEIRRILEDIVEDDRRAGDVIHHLRALLRREDGTRVPIDMNQLVASVLDFGRSDLVLKGVTVTRQLGKDLPFVEGDAVQLQQVLLNLIVNACDAMNRKPAAERSLGIVTKIARNGKLRVSVVDNGTGISEADMNTLFEPFHTTKALGLGLGLPICNWIITAHGGKLVAEANPKGGATFSFDLPLPVEVSDEPREPHRVSC